MTELETSATHLYPGARLHIVSRGEGAAAVVRFGGGVAAGAGLDGGTLSVEGYVTAAGTAVAARRWAVEESGGGLRVTARLPAAGQD